MADVWHVGQQITTDGKRNKFCLKRKISRLQVQLSLYSTWVRLLLINASRPPLSLSPLLCLTASIPPPPPPAPRLRWQQWRRRSSSSPSSAWWCWSGAPRRTATATGRATPCRSMPTRSALSTTPGPSLRLSIFLNSEFLNLSCSNPHNESIRVPI